MFYNLKMLTNCAPILPNRLYSSVNNYTQLFLFLFMQFHIFYLCLKHSLYDWLNASVEISALCFYSFRTFKNQTKLPTTAAF